MKNEMCGFMKKGPPKMSIGLHAKRHLNDGPINIEPACRSKQSGFADRRFEDECDAGTSAKFLHCWLKDRRSFSRQHPDLPNCFLEFSRVERRQIYCPRPPLAQHQPGERMILGTLVGLALTMANGQCRHLGCIGLRQADLEEAKQRLDLCIHILRIGKVSSVAQLLERKLG